MNSCRGAVLVESAFSVSLLLLLSYGGVQLGVVGLEQLSADGGAYTATHQQALLGANAHNYEDAPTLAKATLPHLDAPNVSIPEPVYGQPPTTETTNFVRQYNLNSPNARHGGVSMIQPVQTVGFVTSSNVASLLQGVVNSINVTGIAIDPAFRLINGHGDVGGNDFNGAAAFATASDPLVNGNNAPPYFVGFNYMTQCPYTNASNAKPGWNVCPQPVIAALGLGEYLDVNNWGRPINGVVPDNQAVFYETRLHQNKFSDIAIALSATNALVGVARERAKAAILTPLSGDVKCVYSFDNARLGTYQPGTTKIGDFPMNPAGDPAACSGP